MRTQSRASVFAVVIASVAVGAIMSLWVTETGGQTSRPARIADHPNLSGIWQANNEAHNRNTLLRRIPQQ